MNRTRLVWFAAGAATSACAAILAQSLHPRVSEAYPLLIVEDVTEFPIDGEQNPDLIKASGKALRECGAYKFEMSLGAPDSSEFALLPITRENQHVFQCVLNRDATDNLKLDIWMTRSGYAQTH